MKLCEVLFSAVSLHIWGASPNVCALIGSRVEAEKWLDTLPLTTRVLPCHQAQPIQSVLQGQGSHRPEPKMADELRLLSAALVYGLQL